MRFNDYNRLLDGKIGTIDQERVSAPVRFDGAIPSGMASAAEIERIFAIGPDSLLLHAGCQLRYAQGDLKCIDSEAPVGAVTQRQALRFYAAISLPLHPDTR